MSNHPEHMTRLHKHVMSFVSFNVATHFRTNLVEHFRHHNELTRKEPQNSPLRMKQLLWPNSKDPREHEMAGYDIIIFTDNLWKVYHTFILMNSIVVYVHLEQFGAEELPFCPLIEGLVIICEEGRPPNFNYEGIGLKWCSIIQVKSFDVLTDLSSLFYILNQVGTNLRLMAENQSDYVIGLENTFSLLPLFKTCAEGAVEFDIQATFIESNIKFTPDLRWIPPSPPLKAADGTLIEAFIEERRKERIMWLTRTRRVEETGEAETKRLRVD